MSQRETKSITAEVKLNAEAEGAFEAVIATLGVVDHDGDVMMPGSFEGKVLHILPSHDKWQAPMGKATIREVGDKAVAAGRFNLSVSHGRDWYEAVKFDADNPPVLQEWSFDLENVDAKRDRVNGKNARRIFSFDSKEISPVLRGAGIGTQTVAIKSHAEPCETSTAPWDLVANLRRLGGQDEFLHHFVDEDGTEGKASTRACLLGIAKLNGCMGTLAAKDSERKAIYDHLASHLKAAEIEVPELRPAGEAPGITLADQVKYVTWEVESTVERLQAAAAERKERGRQISEEARAGAIELAAAFAGVEAAAKDLEQLVGDCSEDDAVAQAISSWHVATARLRVLDSRS